MKQVFFTLALVGLAACGNDHECCDHNHEIVIKGRQYDFTQDQVDAHPTDSCGYSKIDSLTTVNELLDYLETLPAE